MRKDNNKSQENTRVENDLDLQHITLADVIDIEFLQRFQDDFAKGMGVASVTVDPEGKPITNPSSYTRFCTDYTHSTECGNKRCAQSHRKGGEEAARRGKPVVYECHAGLIDFAAPIMIEGRLIGTILGGQVLTNIPNEAKYRKIASEIGVDGDDYIEAVKEIKPLSRQRIESAANVLFDVANSMSKTAYQQRKLQNARNVIVNAQRMASLGVMVGSIAHEINQPLNSIKVSASGMLYLIQKGVLLRTEDFQRELSRIVHETERIDQVISKTCCIVREGVPYKGPMLIDGVLCRVLTLLKDQELFKDIKIDHQIVPQKAWIEGNETQIEQVLFHLLTNAAQALKNIDQQEKVIWISVQVADQVILSVVDNGPGLERSTLDKIFEPFFTTSRAAENMGLGLAIVQSIIYAYGGEISAENNLGGGATFKVQFPLIKDLRVQGEEYT